MRDLFVLCREAIADGEPVQPGPPDLKTASVRYTMKRSYKKTTGIGYGSVCPIRSSFISQLKQRRAAQS